MVGTRNQLFLLSKQIIAKTVLKIIRKSIGKIRMKTDSSFPKDPSISRNTNKADPMTRAVNGQYFRVFSFTIHPS